jgi:phosphohistidine phosphatase SixA
VALHELAAQRHDRLSGTHTLLVDPRAGELLVCSHGELIGTVLRRLVGEQLAADNWPKGSTWVLEVDGGQVQHSRYLPLLRLQDPEPGDD